MIKKNYKQKQYNGAFTDFNLELLKPSSIFLLPKN